MLERWYPHWCLDVQTYRWLHRVDENIIELTARVKFVNDFTPAPNHDIKGEKKLKVRERQRI